MPRDSDSLRNENSWDYLNNVTIPDYMLSTLTNFPFAKKVAEIKTTYDNSKPYGNLYTDFLQELEAHIDSYNKGQFPSEPSFDALIKSIYYNNNTALERTAKEIAGTVKKHNQTSGVEGAITEELSPRTSINRTTPTYQGSKIGRFCAMSADNFKPMQSTSIPSVRKYDYQKLGEPEELRFGTQAERHHGNARVSPLFAAWVHIQKSNPSINGITHLYINNLGKDRDWDIMGEGEKERNLTLELEKFGRDNPHIAVITLPADKGMLSSSKLSSSATISTDEIKKSILSIALENGKDFYISRHVKNILYKKSLFTDQNVESLEYKKLSELLENSIKALGFRGKRQLSEREQHALYFHFLKFELTNYIMETLKPNYFNMSCKDAIDRGGVSSAYYNLIKSIENNNHLSQKEFERALHAAPALVKGRGMNDHAQFIWNGIDCYLKGKGKNDKLPRWLVEWRNQNRPVYAYKEGLVFSVRERLKKCESQTELKDLYMQVESGLTDSNSAFRELYRERHNGNYNSNKYCVTCTSKAILKEIKEKILNKVKEDKNVSEGVVSYLSKHRSPYSIASLFGFHTESMRNLKAEYVRGNETKLSI